MASDCVYAEYNTSFEVISTEGVAGHTTFRLAVALPANARNLYAVYGNEDHIILLPPAWQHPSGVNKGGINPLLFTFFDSVAYDSWLTVGVTDGSAELGADPNMAAL